MCAFLPVEFCRSTRRDQGDRDPRRIEKGRSERMQYRRRIDDAEDEIRFIRRVEDNRVLNLLCTCS